MQHDHYPDSVPSYVGQAQPLPAKWVIKRHPGNAEMVNKWANETYDTIDYGSDYGYLHSNGDLAARYRDGFTLISDSQFKAMVEGEKYQINGNCEIYHMPEFTKKERLETLNDLLIKAGFEDMAAEIRNNNPDIWPVDYKEAVTLAAIQWEYAYHHDQHNEPEARTGLFTAVRNYNQSKIEG